MTVRAPGTDEGYRNLCIVKRVYVDFVDNKTFTLRCRSWVPKTDVVPFNEHFDRLRKRTTGANFESSLKHVLQATASTKFPTFVRGTLPKQFEASLATSVKKMKRVMGTAMWLKDFANNRERHSRMHGLSSSASDASRNDEASAEVLALLAMQEAVAAQRRMEKQQQQSPRVKTLASQSPSPRTPTTRQAPLKASASPRPSLKSPRVTSAPSPLIPQVLVHNDEIIVDDDDDDASDNRVAKWRRKRMRSELSSRSPRAKPLVLPSTSSSSDDDEADDDDDDPIHATQLKTEDRNVNLLQLQRVPVLSRVMDVVHDAFPDSPVRKRPSAARTLSLEPDDDVDTEPSTALSPEVPMDSESDAYDADIGVTTEENSNERLLAGHDDTVGTSVDARPAPFAVLGTSEALPVRLSLVCCC